MKKISSLGELNQAVEGKIAKDVVSIMRVSEALLYNMLNNVIQERVYSVYDPIKYERTYKLKNAITQDIGYEKSDNFGKSRIVSRVYIDERKMNYKNKAIRVPRRIDDDRVRRRGDRWTGSIQSSHFMSSAYAEYIGIATKVEKDLLSRGYVRK